MKQKLLQYRAIALFLMLFVGGIGTFIGFRQTQPPSPPAASHSHHQTYERMMDNVKAMAVEPRVPGSPQIEKVRSHIIAQVKAMGLEPTVENRTVTLQEIQAGERQASSNGPSPQGGSGPSPSGQQINEGGNNQGCTRGPTSDPCRDDAVYDKGGNVVLKNILVKLDAPNTDKAMLMAAHYDSDTQSPGAADDLVSVAAMLEAMRAQAQNKQLKNDIYFLFTDGEELGGVGAKGFVQAHPELKNAITHVVNLEARGSRGGLLMFETSTRNYDLVRYFTSAASTPIAFSFTAELYKHMPNGTDLTSFLNEGYSGLNFAIGEGVENYHHASDTFENLDRGSAYQFLLTALEMTDRAAHTAFQDSRQQDGVYFPFWPGNIVIITKPAVYILAVLAIVAAGAWLGLQIRHKKVRIRQIIIDSAWLVGAIAAVALFSLGVVTVAEQTFGVGESDNTTWWFLAQTTVCIGAVLVLFGLRMRKQTTVRAIAGLLPALILLSIASTIFFYSASYLFILPTIALVLVALVQSNIAAKLVASTISSAAILLLFVPVCWLLYILFMLPGSPLALALGVLPLVMLVALFVPGIVAPGQTKPKATRAASK